MPLTRYQIRNEYGLANRELYRAADRDDPEAFLEGVAMAGLVGVLRKLGDLAEFAAEIFHDLHEDVMATATRGHGLMVRVQQIEADFPAVERAILSQTNHSSYFYNSGVEWLSNLRSEQNVVTRGDLPRFVMDSYEECRGPPRLFLLDKFDVSGAGAGAGACLKRYTDPSFFKMESAYSIESEDMQRERKIRKVKHKKGSRWRNGETTPEVLRPSHAKLHELFLEERIENGYSDPARRVKLKKRHVNGSAVDSRTRKSYMDKFLESHSPERKLICAVSGSSPSVNLRSVINESGLRIVDISTVSPAEQGSGSSLPNEQEVVSKELVYMSQGSFDEETANRSESNSDDESDNSYSNIQMVAVEKEMEVDGEDSTEDSVEGYSSDDLPSEVDNYVDALATMESEQDTDNESRVKSNQSLMKVEKCRTVSDANEEEHVEVLAQSLDSQSNENSSMSDDWNNSFERNRDSLNSDTLSNLAENKPSEFVGCEPFDIKENGTNLHSMVVVPDDSSQAKDEFTGASVRPVVEADKEILCAAADDLPHLNNAEESVCVKHSGDDSENEVFQERYADEDSVGNLTSRKIDSPILSIPSTEEQFFPAAMIEVHSSSGTTLQPHSSNVAKPVNRVYRVDDHVKPTAFKSGVLPWRRISRESNPEGDAPHIHVLKEKKDDPQIHALIEQKDDPHIQGLEEQNDDPQTHAMTDQKISDLDKDMSHSKEKFNIEERSRPLDDDVKVEDVNKFIDTYPVTTDVDAEGGDSVSLELPSNSPYSGLGNLVTSDNIVREMVHLEELALSVAAVAESDDVNDIDTSPDTPCFLPLNSLPDSMDPHLLEAELDEVASPKYLSDSETHKELAEVVSSHSESDHFDQLEAASLQSPAFHSDQQGMEDSHHDQDSTNSLNSQYLQVQILKQLDNEIPNLLSTDHIIQETCLDASSDSSLQIRPSQPSSSKFFTELASQETDMKKEKVEPSESILPNLVQAAVVDLEDRPPLPPLPPMQWRLGKMQHTSLASHRDLGGVSNGSFLPMQSMEADENAQLDLPVPQRELLQSQNPFLSLTSVENMKSQPSFEHLVGHVVPPPPYLKVPTDNGSNHQYNFPNLGGMQFSSPFISKVSGHNSEHHDIVLEGEKGLSRLEPFTDPGSESLTPTQDPSFLHKEECVHARQLIPETGSELVVLKQSSSNPELEQARPLAVSLATPTVEDEQPQHASPRTEGGHVQSISEPLLVPGTESTTSKHDSSFSHEETVQPSQQLTHDSGLEPEDLFHSSRILEKEQEVPLATSVSTTTVVNEKPQYSLSVSERATAWSSNTSDVMLDSEVGKSNGTVNKIPRPRNPLIDAVTAYGQSKLKKASERVQPQIEPKVDENDSFLQQIRTKSFNLKPATVTRSMPRPNIQGHNPNLKVISLLEKKAIVIRQAFVGSDEDDDDSWSDS